MLLIQNEVILNKKKRRFAMYILLPWVFGIIILVMSIAAGTAIPLPISAISFLIGFIAYILECLIGYPLGIYLARRRNKILDKQKGYMNKLEKMADKIRISDQLAAKSSTNSIKQDNKQWNIANVTDNGDDFMFI